MTISPYIYAIHDTGGEHLMGQNRGWIVLTRAIGSSGDGGEDFSGLANQGYGVIVRLNHGYGSSGTLPVESQYPQFAARCANFVQRSSGVDFWIIGNETNGPREWPNNIDGDFNSGEPITVARYVSCYVQCFDRIRAAVPSAKICPAGVGTWGPPLDGSHSAFPNRGVPGFLVYWQQMLAGIGAARIDALILHAYTHGCDPALVTSEAKAGDPVYATIHWHFRVYRDYLAALGDAALRSKPVLITECDQVVECADNATPRNAWRDVNSGWVKAIYAEVNAWNAANAQKIWCVALFRWENADEGEYTFTICNKPNIHADFSEAVAFNYRWGTPLPPPPPPSDGMIDAMPSGSNLARTATTTTSSNFGGDWTGVRAIDGVVSEPSKWTSANVSPPHWLMLDLGNSCTVDGYVVKHAGAANENVSYNTRAFQIQSASSPSGPWTDETIVDNSGRANQTQRKYPSAKSLRYVRLYITQPNSAGDNYARIPEFEVWGTSAVVVPPPPPRETVVDLELPYVHQLTAINSFDGSTASGPACAVMLLAAMQRLTPRPLTVPYPTTHTNNWSWYVSNAYSVDSRFHGGYTFSASQADGSNRAAQGAYGSCTSNQVATAALIRAYLERHDLGHRTEDVGARVTIENLRRELDAGAPVLLATYMPGSTVHWIVVRGYDSAGDLIVNDPRGAYSNGSWSGSGERVTYSWQQIRGPQARTPLCWVAGYAPQYLSQAGKETLALLNDGANAGQIDVRFFTTTGNLDSSEVRQLGAGASTSVPPRAAAFSGSAAVRPWHAGLGALAVEATGDANLDNLAQAHGVAGLEAFGRIARTLYFPTLYSHIYGYESSLRILNAGLATATDVRLQLLGRAGNYSDRLVTYTLAPGACLDIPPAALIGQDPWVGSVVITASQPLAACSRDVDSSGAARTSSSTSMGAARLYAPVLYRESYGFSSGVVVQNLGNVSTDVEIELRSRNGALTYTAVLSGIAPLRAAGIFLPSLGVDVLPSGWAGTGVITSRNGQPLVAQVSASKPNSGLATYNAATLGTRRAVIPRAVKLVGGRSTSILMQSTGGALSVRATYLNASGGVAMTIDYAINAQGGVGQFLGSLAQLPDGWTGSITLEASAASLVAVVREDSTTTISSANALPSKAGVGASAGAGGISEDFGVMPAWSSSADASWGGSASWSIVSGGSSGTCLQATRGSAGSSTKVKVYDISPNTTYTITISMSCAGSGSGSWWIESGYRLGNHAAGDFDANAGAWSLVKKFASDGEQGNGGTWVAYSASFSSGSNTQVSVGFKSGSSPGGGPAVSWDTLKIT